MNKWIIFEKFEIIYIYIYIYIVSKRYDEELQNNVGKQKSSYRTSDDYYD